MNKHFRITTVIVEYDKIICANEFRQLIFNSANVVVILRANKVEK